MPITWPSTLPLPTVQGYGIRPGEAILRTEMEAGPARQRRRFTRQFDARPLGGTLWEITSELEIRERPTLTPDALAIALESDMAALFATIDRLHGLVHTSLPGPLSW